MKTRYSKPFESIKVKIPYSTGMSPTSGLIGSPTDPGLFERLNVLTKSGNKLQYVCKSTGKIISEFRKDWTEEQLLTIMKEWDSSAIIPVIEVENNLENENG